MTFMETVEDNAKAIVYVCLLINAAYLFLNLWPNKEEGTGYSIMIPIALLALAGVVFKTYFIHRLDIPREEPRTIGPSESFIPQQPSWVMDKNERPIPQPRAPPEYRR